MHQASPPARHTDRIHDALCRCTECKPGLAYDDHRESRIWVALATFFCGFGLVSLLASFA